jgi:hypothetical protein
MRRIYILLVLWFLFLIAPGLIVETSVFGDIGPYSLIPGSVIFVWIVGYLAQFGVFMWIMNIVGKQTTLSAGAQLVWWFLGSLLPLAVDWSLPVSISFLLLWLPVAIVLAVWIALVASRAESLQLQGIPARGVVLEVLKPLMNVVVNNVYIKRKVRLRIEREDGAPSYEGILNGLFMLGEIPSVGETIPLIVDPAKPQHFDYQKTPRTTHPSRALPATPSGTTDRSRALPTALSGSAHTSPTRQPALSQTSRPNIADELQKLADLRDRGALTDSEFAAAKKKLLH